VTTTETTIGELLGKTMRQVTRGRDEDGGDCVDFEAVTGERWRMHHEQDCCELCDIEDVAGDLDDLVGVPIVMAEESTSSDDPRDPLDGSFTWTFYRLATARGYVTIRWYGSSNGCYGETASFDRISP